MIQTIFKEQQEYQYIVKQTTANQRKEKIKKLLNYLKDHKDEFHRAMKMDLHRDSVDIDAEWLMVKGEAEFAIKNIGKWIKPHRVKNSMMSFGTTSYYQYEPKGVVLVMTPWNAPLAIPLVPLIGLLASGNTGIIKPSELSPATSDFIQKLVKDLFSQKEISVIQGGKSVAQELLTLPFNHIFFTGGAAIGKIVLKAAAENLTPVTLELGGKNPVIVDATADVDNTASKIAWGKCANCGQACVAPDYILVEKSVQKQLIDRLSFHFTKMYNPNGEGIQKSNEYARIISQNHFDRIKDLFSDAVEKGAVVEFGGTHDRDSLFFEPTVLSGVNDTMRIMQDEIFGPLLAVKSWDNSEEALEYIQKKPKPLSSYFYSRNAKNVRYYLANTSSGNSVVNHNMIQAGINPHLPFGGIQSSGSGRIVGKNTFTAFSNQRSIVKQPLGLLDYSRISFPPYSNLYKKVLKRLAG